MNRIVCIICLLSTCFCLGVSGRFEEVRRGAESRWELLEHNEFVSWDPLWRENVEKRFEKLSRDRWGVYFIDPEECLKGKFGTWNASFAMPDRWKSWHSRYPYPIAPKYSLAAEDYNASLIAVEGLHFIALEAPCEENVEAFFSLLDAYSVTDLVRLTPESYNGKNNCYPYWERKGEIEKRNYLFTDTWEDHQGWCVSELIALVDRVRFSGGEEKVVAVHCKAGVGRTGTFIASYVLLSHIDKQLCSGVQIDDVEVPIDKVVWQICLQRPFAVTHLSQYRTLYAVVEEYLRQKGRQI